MPAKVLVVDDDAAVLKMACRFLEVHGFAVVHADNGSEALILARESLPDVVLADAEMPGLDGHALCRVLKSDPATRAIPVLIMSGQRKRDEDIIAGFDGGADDYVAKPFALPVLLARLRAAIRRSLSAAKRESKLRKAGIELDPAGRTVKVAGREASLTRKEFDLLAALLSKAGRLLSVPYLLETVWGYDLADYNDPGTVEVHVSHLRRKLGPKAAHHIVNVLGFGYKFVA